MKKTFVYVSFVNNDSIVIYLRVDFCSFKTVENFQQQHHGMAMPDWFGQPIPVISLVRNQE